jgi:hypothetical protein
MSFVLVTPSPHNAFGYARALHGLRVLTTDTLGVAALRAAGADVAAVPVPDGPLTTHALVTSAAGAEVLSAWAPAGAVVFRPDVRTAQALEAVGCTLVSADPGVARALENKRNFRTRCLQWGLPIVSFVEAVWPPTDLESGPLADMSWPRVLQTARGHAGKRTWSWDSAHAVPPIPEALLGRKILVSPLLEGPTWTANAVVTPDDVFVGPPMLQISGDARLSDNPMASCGVAINPPASAGIVDELTELTRGVAIRAREAGFLGFFGIDAVGVDRLDLIEMNARLTATMTVATLAELQTGTTPLTVLHAKACTGEPIASDAYAPPRQPGGHLIVRDAEERGEPLGVGTYQTGVNGLQRLSGAVGWPEPGTVAVWPAGPVAGGPEGEWCRLLFGEQMVDAEGELTGFAARVVESLVLRAP